MSTKASPTSYVGATRRLWALGGKVANTWIRVPVYVLLVVAIVAAWVLVTAWYVILIPFLVIVIPFRLIRRGQR